MAVVALSVNMLKFMEWYTLNGLIIWHVNYISKKVVFKN